MMDDAIAWTGRAIVLAIVALFARLRALERQRAEANVRLQHLEDHESGATQAGRRMSSIEHRLSTIEGRLEGLPTAQAHAALSKDIGKVAATVEGVRAGQEALHMMVERLSIDVRELRP